MSNTLQNYNDDIREINRNLQELKRAGASYDPILEEIKELRERFTQSLIDVRTKKDNLINFKDEKMKKIEKVQRILKEHQDKINYYNESVEQYTNVSKTVISEIDFKKLKNVERDQNVENLFRFFYETLYYENPSTFDYKEFVNVALKKNVQDFQTRLARFQIIKLSKHHREQIKELKEASYPQKNDSFNSLLEWIDYNYEAYLALKQKELTESKRSSFKESDLKYQNLIENSKYIQDEQNQILSYLEDYIYQLDHFERKIQQAKEMSKNNSSLRGTKKDTNKLFSKIDSFEGNNLASEIDSWNL